MSEKTKNYLSNLPTQLPLPDDVSYYELEKDRKIFLDFDIDDPVFEIERLIFRWNMEDKDKPVEERKPIWIYIFSLGGYGYHMWSIVDIISASKTPVYTVNIGACMSAASIIFLSGHKRFMFPRAKVLIHQGSNHIEGDAQKVIDQTASYQADLKQMQEYILARTSIPATLLKKKKNNDWEIDADFCLENNVCDVVVSSIDEVL